MKDKRQLELEPALNRAADLCSKAEYSEREIRDRLYRWGVDRADTEDIIIYLKNHRFIDEMRFAHAFVHDKFKYSNWGRKKIRLHLMHNRISAAAINEALDTIDDDEYFQIMLKHVKIKSRIYDITDSEERKKIISSLTTRGFERHLLYEAIDEYLKHHESEQ